MQTPATGSTRIGFASLPGPSQLPVGSAQAQAVMQRYLAAIDRMAAQGARLVVLSETVFAADSAYLRDVAASAARNDITIAVGVAVDDVRQGKRNMALAFLPTKPGMVGYAKHHLIPGFEIQYAAATDYALLPGISTGLAVCKDMDFHDVACASEPRCQPAAGPRLGFRGR